MRVDKLTMAHSIEARVPFLDHDRGRVRHGGASSYKLSDGLGKKDSQKDGRALCRSRPPLPPQAGFRGAHGQVVSAPCFGRALPLALEQSHLYNSTVLLNRDYVMGLLRGQVGGTINCGFHLWTVMNAVFGHQRWIDKQRAVA